MTSSAKALMTRRHALGTLAALASGLAQAQPAAPGGATDLRALVAAAKPSVFAIGLFARMAKPAFRFSGTCFAIPGGLFVTCAHVIQLPNLANREFVAVAIPSPGGHKIIEVNVVATNRENDLAVVEPVNPLTEPVKALQLNNTLPAEGTEIVLIGYPIGSALGLHAATHRGIVSAVVPMAFPLPTTTGLEARNVQALRAAPLEILQLDATAYPGNSGSPVIDTHTGQVLAVVSLTMIKGTRESAMTSPSGISYAVPVQHLTGMIPTR